MLWLVCLLCVQGSDVDIMKKRAERFGEITSSKLGKVGRVSSTNPVTGVLYLYVFGAEDPFSISF